VRRNRSPVARADHSVRGRLARAGIGEGEVLHTPPDRTVVPLGVSSRAVIAAREPAMSRRDAAEPVRSFFDRGLERGCPDRFPDPTQHTQASVDRAFR